MSFSRSGRDRIVSPNAVAIALFLVLPARGDVQGCSDPFFAGVAGLVRNPLGERRRLKARQS
jgi:hypothetical protein